VTYPSDEVMHCLHAILSADEVSLFEDGELKAHAIDPASWTGRSWVVIPLEAQDELIRRGWIELVGVDELEVLPAGSYWCERWCREREKAQRRGATQRRAM